MEVVENYEDIEFIYALKCIVYAHDADVRVIKPTSIPEGGILTGSRDTTTKVWGPVGHSFKEHNTFKGATAFIASLCVLPPSAQYPNGLFLAGSNDCSIYGFTPDSTEPILRLLGHSGAVCSLSYGKGGFIISGSWDKTARVWSGQQCVLTLQGHLEAVWATDVFPTQNLILTGSADHTIRLWRQGTCEKVFSGHEDCVRGLAIMSDMKFLSCSNDTTVRLWLTSGECLQVFKSHTDYIYSICLLNHGMDFATCGEDQSIKIWRNGVCIQTVVLSSKSVWDVACLSNGDLAVGTSEGKVYVFDKVRPEFFAYASSRDPDSSKRLPLSEDTDVKSSICSGQTIITYLSQSREMFLCKYDSTGVGFRMEDLDFQFIEDIFYKKVNEEAAGNSSNPSKKKDYVFDVDVEDDIYKLSFNKGENPYEIASKFVAEHNLPTEHVTQIVDYIIKNTVMTFTTDMYPARKYLTYQSVNIDGLRTKLLEFCSHADREKYISPAEVDELMLLAQFPDVVSVEQMSNLDKVISWNDEFLFPVLDLLRLGVQCKGLRSKVSSKTFVNHLLQIFMNSSKSVNRVLIEKILCNMFGIQETLDVLITSQEKIFATLKDKLSAGEESIQKAAAALLYNFAIASYNGVAVNVDRFCSTVIDSLNYVVDHEAIYRVLVAIGTVCTRSTLAITYFRSVNIKEFILRFKTCTDDTRVEKVVELLCDDF